MLVVFSFNSLVVLNEKEVSKGMSMLMVYNK